MPLPDACVRPLTLGGRPLLVWIDRERTASGYAFQVFDPERYAPQTLSLDELAAAQAAVEEIMQGERDDEERPLPPAPDEEDDAEQVGVLTDLEDDDEDEDAPPAA